jgi:hypothetical protein
MSDELVQPSEKDDTSCHLQEVGMGSLICRAARQRGEHSTNEVNRIICFNCPVGKIFREVRCDAALPKIHIIESYGEPSNYFDVLSLICRIRKTDTTLEYCRKCGLPVAETTREIVSTAKGIFEKYGFYSAYQDLEKARTAIRDGNFENAVTRSIDSLESTMRICHEEMGKPLPDKKQVTELWKSARVILGFDKMDPTGATERLLNSLSGLMTNIGAIRNALGDAHGKGKYPPQTSANIAELAINISSSMSTAIIRRFLQIREKKNESN